MKLVKMILPDSMIKTRGGVDHREITRVEVDGATVVLALAGNDYHDNWFIEDVNSIKILSIEDYRPGPEDAVAEGSSPEASPKGK